jgi:hypothetical protein
LLHTNPVIVGRTMRTTVVDRNIGLGLSMRTIQ